MAETPMNRIALDEFRPATVRREIESLTTQLQSAQERANELSESLLVLLVKGLGCYEPPSHGHTPIFAQVAWMLLEKQGKDYTAEVLKMLRDSREYESDIVNRNIDDIRERVKWYMTNDPTLPYRANDTKEPSPTTTEPRP